MFSALATRLFFSRIHRRVVYRYINKEEDTRPIIATRLFRTLFKLGLILNLSWDSIERPSTRFYKYASRLSLELPR
jgi:hypothetical protein